MSIIVKNQTETGGIQWEYGTLGAVVINAAQAVNIATYIKGI